MASSFPAHDSTISVDAAVKSMPREAPPLTNPPATLDQIATDHADRARAAVGGAATAGRPAKQEASPMPRSARGERLHRSPRFEAPPELDFEFTPPTSQQIPNSNLPLTIGLLFSIVASFVIFFVSLAASNSGADPIMPAFWRALGSLAVLMTLSFAASWFMPTPQDHHQLLDQLDAQDRALGRYQAPDAAKQTEPRAGGVPDDEGDDLDKGMSVDLTVQDDDFEDEDELALAEPQDEDYFDDDEDEDLPTSPNHVAGAAVAASGTGQ